MKVQASSTRVKLLLRAYEGEIAAGSRVLDIGCGNGLISRAVATTFGCEVHGADIENLLEHDMPFYRIADGRVGAADQSFDVAMFNDVLHHIEKPHQAGAIREALRIARRLLIFEQHPTITAKVLDVVMAYVVYAGKEPLPLSHRGPDDWRTLITSQITPTCRVKPVAEPMLYPLRHYAIIVEPAAETGGVTARPVR